MLQASEVIEGSEAPEASEVSEVPKAFRDVCPSSQGGSAMSRPFCYARPPRPRAPPTALFCVLLRQRARPHVMGSACVSWSGLNKQERILVQNLGASLTPPQKNEGEFRCCGWSPAQSCVRAGFPTLRWPWALPAADNGVFGISRLRASRGVRRLGEAALHGPGSVFFSRVLPVGIAFAYKQVLWRSWTCYLLLGVLDCRSGCCWLRMLLFVWFYAAAGVACRILCRHSFAGHHGSCGHVLAYGLCCVLCSGLTITYTQVIAVVLALLWRCAGCPLP